MATIDRAPLQPQGTLETSHPEVLQQDRLAANFLGGQPCNKKKGKRVKKKPACASARAAKTQPTLEIPVTAASHRDLTRTCSELLGEEPPHKMIRGTRLSQEVLSGSSPAGFIPGDNPVMLSEVVIHAIDRQIAIHFPELPRTPTMEFQIMLRHILQSGLTLGDGLRLAEEHRLRGEAWPK